jgi:hypothetical protein
MPVAIKVHLSSIIHILRGDTAGVILREFIAHRVVYDTNNRPVEEELS